MTFLLAMFTHNAATEKKGVTVCYPPGGYCQFAKTSANFLHPFS